MSGVGFCSSCAKRGGPQWINCARGTFKIHPFKRLKTALNLQRQDFQQYPKLQRVVLPSPPHTPGITPQWGEGVGDSDISPATTLPCSSCLGFPQLWRETFYKSWNPGPGFSPLPFSCKHLLTQERGRGGGKPAVSMATALSSAWLLLRLRSWSRGVFGLLDVVCGSLRPFLPQMLLSLTHSNNTHPHTQVLLPQILLTKTHILHIFWCSPQAQMVPTPTPMQPTSSLR